MRRLLAMVSVAFVMLQSTAWRSGNDQNGNNCQSPRYVDFHLKELLGIWFQYAYVINITTNTVALFSCEIFNVTYENGTYIGDIYQTDLSVPSSVLEIRELPGPVFYLNNTKQPLTAVEIITTLTRRIKVSMANTFVSGAIDVPATLLASRFGYPDPKIHERLLQSNGYHIDENSSTIPPDRCPMRIGVPAVPTRN